MFCSREVIQEENISENSKITIMGCKHVHLVNGQPCTSMHILFICGGILYDNTNPIPSKVPATSKGTLCYNMHIFAVYNDVLSPYCPYFFFFYFFITTEFDLTQH